MIFRQYVFFTTIVIAGGPVLALPVVSLAPFAVAATNSVSSPTERSTVMAPLPNPGGTTGTAVNALSLGLVCDGKTDNAKIFEAIRVKAMQTSGQTIYFPPASLPCLSSQPLVAASKTTYKADPGSMTLKPSVASAANPTLFRADGVSDVLIDGLGFEGDLGPSSNSNSVVVVYRSARIVLERVTVRNTAGVGIAFSTEVSESGLRSSNLVNVGSRWKFTGRRGDQHQGVVFCCGNSNHDNFVVDSTFDDIGLDAISFTQQTHFLAEGNRSTNAGAAVAGVLGARLASGLSGKDLVGGAAVYGASSNSVKVVNNVSDGAGGNGIDLFKVNEAEIVGNTARRSGGNGIGFGAASSAQITHNVVVDNNQARAGIVSAPQAGIFLTGGRNGQPAVRRVTISGNIVTDDQPRKTQNYGIQLQDGSVASEINVDESNRLNGNAMAQFGEGFAHRKPGVMGSR
jgi:hypothetical protein